MKIQLVGLAVLVCMQIASATTVTQLNDLLKSVLPPMLVNNQNPSSGVTFAHQTSGGPAAPEYRSWNSFGIPNVPSISNPWGSAHVPHANSGNNGANVPPTVPQHTPEYTPANPTDPAQPLYSSYSQPDSGSRSYGTEGSVPVAQDPSSQYYGGVCIDTSNLCSMSSYPTSGGYSYDYTTGQYYQTPVSYVYVPVTYSNYICDDVPSPPSPTPSPPTPAPAPIPPKKNLFKPAILNSILHVDSI